MEDLYLNEINKSWDFNQELPIYEIINLFLSFAEVGSYLENCY